MNPIISQLGPSLIPSHALKASQVSKLLQQRPSEQTLKFSAGTQQSQKPVPSIIASFVIALIAGFSGIKAGESRSSDQVSKLEENSLSLRTQVEQLEENNFSLSTQVENNEGLIQNQTATIEYMREQLKMEATVASQAEIDRLNDQILNMQNKNIFNGEGMFYYSGPEGFEAYFNHIYRKTDPRVQHFLEHRGLTSIILNDGYTVEEFGAQVLGDDNLSNDNAYYIAKHNIIVFPIEWALMEDSASLLHHEMGHALSYNMALYFNDTEPALTEEWKNIVDNLTPDGWAYWGSWSPNPDKPESLTENSRYVELFARAFDDYTNLNNPDSPNRYELPERVRTYIQTQLERLSAFE